jgi:hypothetical protein
VLQVKLNYCKISIVQSWNSTLTQESNFCKSHHLVSVVLSSFPADDKIEHVFWYNSIFILEMSVWSNIHHQFTQQSGEGHHPSIQCQLLQTSQVITSKIKFWSCISSDVLSFQLQVNIRAQRISKVFILVITYICISTLRLNNCKL